MHHHSRTPALLQHPHTPGRQPRQLQAPPPPVCGLLHHLLAHAGAPPFMHEPAMLPLIVRQSEMHSGMLGRWEPAGQVGGKYKQGAGALLVSAGGAGPVWPGGLGARPMQGAARRAPPRWLGHAGARAWMVLSQTWGCRVKWAAGSGSRTRPAPPPPRSPPGGWSDARCAASSRGPSARTTSGRRMAPAMAPPTNDHAWRTGEEGGYPPARAPQS